MKNKDYLILGAFGVAGYFLFLKPALETAKGIEDFSGAVGQVSGATADYWSELLKFLNPNTYTTPLITYLGSQRFETPQAPQVPQLTGNNLLLSNISRSPGYLGVITYNKDRSINVPTPQSAKIAASSFLMSGGNANLTTQQRVASSLGVPTSYINPNVNKTPQFQTKNNSSALFKYLK
jgi:hypothetical protein